MAYPGRPARRIIRFGIVFAGTTLASILAVHSSLEQAAAAPPPNDNFENRTVPQWGVCPAWCGDAHPRTTVKVRASLSG